jgi:hypothetical protein
MQLAGGWNELRRSGSPDSWAQWRHAHILVYLYTKKKTQQLKVLRKMFRGRSCALNARIIHHRFPGGLSYTARFFSTSAHSDGGVRRCTRQVRPDCNAQAIFTSRKTFLQTSLYLIYTLKLRINLSWYLCTLCPVFTRITISHTSKLIAPPPRIMRSKTRTSNICLGVICSSKSVLRKVGIECNPN